MLNSFKRTFHFAVLDLSRNKGVALAAAFVLLVTTMLVTGVFFFRGMSNFLIDTVQDKIDITAYFKEDTQEQDIIAIKDQLALQVPGITAIEYVSKEQALATFMEKHSENDVLSRALGEVGGNPFLPALNINTNGDTSKYQQIATVLEDSQYQPFIEKVDFSEKKDTIEKVFSITSKVNIFGLVLGGVLTLLSMLVVFNTVRLVVESSKDEISTMRIVGATNWFIRAPFIIEGALFGVISFFACLVITGLVSYFLSPAIAVVMPGFSLWGYFVAKLGLIVLLQLGFGAALGALSSLIAVHKYLKM